MKKLALMMFLMAVFLACKRGEKESADDFRKKHGIVSALSNEIWMVFAAQKDAPGSRR